MDRAKIEKIKTNLRAELEKPPGILFDRLVVEGIITEQGEVTGKVHRWTSYLAIVQVKRDPATKQICKFHCLRPIFGIPDNERRDVTRESVVQHLKEGRKIITAWWDQRLEMWREGSPVHLPDDGGIRLQSSTEPEDNVGIFRKFHR